MIETLLEAPESKTLEFKRDLSSPKPLVKSLVAFANSAGGKLVIGVADDKRIIGVGAPLAEEFSRIRNPVIARVFRELGLIEQWGSGVRRIFREAEEQQLPLPEIIEIGMRVRFTVPLRAPLTVSADANPVEAQVEAQVVLDILAACARQPLSSAEIASALGHKQLSGNLRKAIPRLRTAGLLEYTLPAIPNSRLQKYRLTPKGRSLIPHTTPP